MTTLSRLADRHCAATKPQLSFKNFVPEAYGITHRQFCRIAAGRYGANAQFLKRLSNCHVRLFPTESVTLRLPNQPPVLIGKPSNSKIPTEPNPQPCAPSPEN